MTISSFKSLEASQSRTVTVASANIEKSAAEQVKQSAENSREAKKISEDDLKNASEAMNKFLELSNADLHFAVHKKTNTLMVQLIDTREQKVLKEFPPHEFLDTIAKVRDYVGFLLDKRV